MHMPRWRAVEEDAEIDLAPLLDVVFIMLIFFVVAAPLLRETGIGVTSTARVVAAAGAAQPSLVLTIGADDRIRFDEQRIDVRLVRAHLERLHAIQPQAALIVRAHEDSSTEVFAAVAAQAREAGIHDIALATFRE